MTGTAQIPAGVSAFYDRNLLERAVPALVHDKWGQMRNLPKGNSDTVKFRRWNALSTATTPLTEGVTPTGSSMSVTDVTATILQYGDYTTLTDKVSLVTEDNVIKEATDVLGEQGGETLDEVCRDVLVAGTSVVYAGATVTPTIDTRVEVAAAVATADLDVCIKTLKGQNAKKFTEMVTGTTKVGTAPIKAAFVGICHTDTSETLETLTGWTGAEAYASSTLIDMNEIGSYKYIRFIETTMGKVFTGEGAASADVYGTLIFGKNAYGVVSLRGQKNIETIVKPLGSAGTADPLNQRATVGWKAWTITKILNDNFMVRLESAE